MATMKLMGGKKPKAGSTTDIEKAEPSLLESITPIESPKLDNPLQPKLMDLPKGNEAEMQKVRDYQIKLNKKGAGLVVDGVWGEKTAAASREYYNKYQKPQSIPKSNASRSSRAMKLSKGDTEFKSVTPTKLPDTPAAENYFKNKKNTTVDKQITPTPKKGKILNFLENEGLKEDRKIAEKRVQIKADSLENEYNQGMKTAYNPMARTPLRIAGQAQMKDSSEKYKGLTGKVLKNTAKEEEEKIINSEDNHSTRNAFLISGAAMLGGAALARLGVRGKIKNTRAIIAAAQAGDDLPKKMKFGEAVMSEVREGVVGKVARGVQKKANKIEEKLLAPMKKAKESIKEVTSLSKTVNKAQKEGAYKKSMRLGQPTRDIVPDKVDKTGLTEGRKLRLQKQAERENVAFDRNKELAQPTSEIKPLSSDKTNTLGRQSRQRIRDQKIGNIESVTENKPTLLLGDGGRTKKMKLDAGKSVLSTMKDVRKKAINKINVASKTGNIKVTEQNYKQLGYRKEINGGLFRYVKK